MSYIKGYDRTQAVLFQESIDEIIAPDNVVRFIDVFVNSLDIPSIGFSDVNKNVNGRPPYHPKDLLKLYIYGYLNKIRASCKLEVECQRNIELMWLMSRLAQYHFEL